MMGSPNGHQPPSIGEQLGLGKHWVPAPAGWGFASFQTPQGTMHVIVFDTAAGRVAVALSPEDLRRFAGQALEASSGLVVPQ